jgi:hypothetical protein
LVAAGRASLFGGSVPLPGEVAAPELRALWTREDERVRARPGEGGQVLGHVIRQETRDGKHAVARRCDPEADALIVVKQSN